MKIEWHQARRTQWGEGAWTTMGEVRLDEGK
jgi:hypothetical protein